MKHPMAPAAVLVKEALFSPPVKAGRPPPNPYNVDCPTRMALNRFADTWTGLLLGLLVEQPMPFNQLREAVEGLSRKMASQTLKTKERDGLVTRTATAPVTVEHAIPPLGSSLAGAPGPLVGWARDRIDEVLHTRARYERVAA